MQIYDDSTCCQAWVDKETRFSRWEESKRESNWEKIQKCIQETQGQIVTYQNQPINAFFHANSGGKTELPVNVWEELDYRIYKWLKLLGKKDTNNMNQSRTYTR